MQFLLVLAVLAVLVVAEYSPSQPVSHALVRLVIAASGMALVPLLAAVSSGLIARRLRADFQQRSQLVRRFRRIRQLHAVLWLVVAAGIVYGLEWTQIVRVNWRLERAFLIDDVLILLPLLLPLILSWAAFYEVDRVVHVGFANRTPWTGPLTTRRQYLALHARHYLGLLLLPVLGLLAVQDSVRLLLPNRAQGDYALLAFAPPALLMVAVFPLLLRHIWRTRSLPPGPLRDRLEQCARRAGLRMREILIWETDGMVANAAVTGFLPSFRYVFLTDGLLDHLRDDEIEAIFGHELGHVRHRHLFIRVATMMIPWSLWLLFGQAWPHATERIEAWLQSGGPAFQSQMGLLALTGMGIYALVVFGGLSRSLEHQADLFGCRVLRADHGLVPVEAFVSALERLGDVAGGRKASGWQHASIARRVEFLRRAIREPGRERQFHRKVRLLGNLAIPLLVGPLLFLLLW